MQVIFDHDRLRLSLTLPRLHRLYLSFLFLHQRPKEKSGLQSRESHSVDVDFKIKMICYLLILPLQGKLLMEVFNSLLRKLVVVLMYYAY